MTENQKPDEAPKPAMTTCLRCLAPIKQGGGDLCKLCRSIELERSRWRLKKRRGDFDTQ